MMNFRIYEVSLKEHHVQQINKSSLWPQFAKGRPIWWRSLFAELSTVGFIDNSSPIVQGCLRFCFMRVLREELEELKNC